MKSAYVFHKNETVWEQVSKLTASDAYYSAYFGFSVSISGDYIVVGASNDRTGTGAVYVFFNNGNNWQQSAKLIAADGTSHDYFGCSVSIMGDYFIAGAKNDDDNGEDSGSAYIFKRSGTSWC